MISISNHGQLITATNYWTSELAIAGKLFVSVNAGAIRVLLPPQLNGLLNEMRTGKECVLSRGPWPHYSIYERGSRNGAMTRWAAYDTITGEEESWYPTKQEVVDHVASLNKNEGIEILFDDASDSPFALHLTPESFDMLPAEPAPGHEWLCTVWIDKDGRPHKALERICHWRRVRRIPWMKAWGYFTRGD